MIIMIMIMWLQGMSGCANEKEEPLRGGGKWSETTTSSSKSRDHDHQVSLLKWRRLPFCIILWSRLG